MKRNISPTESAKDPTIAMDSEAEFQLQPSSSVEALTLLLGAGLDRVQVANLLFGADSSGQRPSSRDRGGDQVYSASCRILPAVEILVDSLIVDFHELPKL